MNDPVAHPINIDRRVVLLAGTLGTAGLVGLSGCSRPQENDTSEQASKAENATPAIPLEDLPVGASTSVQLGDEEFLLHRESADEIHVFSAICTHQGCIVDILTQGEEARFSCPCHYSQFDLVSGDRIAGPAKEPLTRHQSEIRDGWINIWV